MSFSPLGMTVSFGLASLRPSLPAFSLARFVWPSFSLLLLPPPSRPRASASSGTRPPAAPRSSRCARALSASGGRGASFSHMKTRRVAKMPSTMLVPSIVWTISGSSTRGRGDDLGRIDPADLDAQVAAVGEGQLGAIAARQIDLAGRRRRRPDVAVPPSDQLALELGREAQDVAVARAASSSRKRCLPAERRRRERRALAASRRSPCGAARSSR